MFENRGPESRFVDELMREMRSSLGVRLEHLHEQLAPLEAALTALFREGAFDDILAPLQVANSVIAETHTHECPGSDLSPEEMRDLETLARPPGFSRPAWHPKRWVADLLGGLLSRHYAFNLRVKDCLVRLARQQAQTRQIVLALVAAENAHLHHTIAYEREVCQYLRSLVEGLALLLPSLLGSFSSSPSSPPSPPAAPPEDTPAAKELREFLCQLSDHENRLERLEAAMAEIAALRSQLPLIQRWTNSIEKQTTEALSRLREEIEELRKRAAEFSAGATGTWPTPQVPAATPRESPRSSPTFSFLEFERALRGGELQIAQEQSKYLEWFRGRSPILDAGCGRGEFLELLRSHGIAAYGIDADEDMVAYCQRKGLDVRLSTLEEHLESLEDGSLGGIFLGQVVEHLPQELLLALPALIRAKLAPGGAVVIETVNPMCLSTFAGAMYADPTHVRPIHPKGLEFLFLSAGFVETTIILSAPVAEDDKLAPLREKAPLDPVLKDLVLQMNANIERLNTLLYSYANYALAACKPL